MEGIAWDVVTMLLPFLGRKATEPKATDALTLLATKGNAKEVFLKSNEALKGIEWQPRDDDGDDEYGDSEATGAAETLKNLSIAEGDAEEIDPVKQVVALYRATDIGSLILIGMYVNYSIQEDPNGSTSAVSNEFRGRFITCRHSGFPVGSRTGGSRHPSLSRLKFP